MITAVVIGKFLPPHRGHSYLIERALAGADRVTVIVCERADDPYPVTWRIAALRELHPRATVVSTVDDIVAADPAALSRAWAGRTLDLLGMAPQLVFSSEEYGPRYAGFLGALHVAVDPRRERYAVSGTRVRADPWGQAAFLAPVVRAWFVTRVCVLGAESTGTTTMAQALAEHYGCDWVPEYGRAYCELRGGTVDWRSGEFEHIAREQQADEDRRARAGGRLLICDTDALATSVWHERYLGWTSPIVARIAARRGYPLTLLTADDIPFVQDGTRDGEHLRGAMTARFRKVLSGRCWLELRGDHATRLATAVAAVDELLSRTQVGLSAAGAMGRVPACAGHSRPSPGGAWPTGAP